MSAENWLDDLARVLARGASRRDAVRAIGAALAGVALASVRSERASAAPHSTTVGDEGGAGGIVAQIPRFCQPPLTQCGNRCLNLNIDERNCGACGRRCGPNEECLGGGCGCRAGFCRNPDSGRCVSNQTDPNNCGACGNVCTPPSNGHGRAECRGGQCRIICDRGFASCDSSQPCATDLTSDPDNCGGCGRRCAAGEVCTNGRCEEGSCSPSCANGEPCLAHSDCQSGLCLNNVCAPCSAFSSSACPTGFCCDDPQFGTCVAQCPAGQCCDDLSGGGAVCVASNACPSNGCCSNGRCRLGTLDTECGNNTTVTCADCTQSAAGDVCLAIDKRCGCITDGDCGSGEVCNATTKACEPTTCPTGTQQVEGTNATGDATTANNTCPAECTADDECTFGNICCSGTCCPSAYCCGTVCCSSTQACSSGSCVSITCPSTHFPCNSLEGPQCCEDTGQVACSPSQGCCIHPDFCFPTSACCPTFGGVII